jgi:hypothetical protein
MKGSALLGTRRRVLIVIATVWWRASRRMAATW